MGRRALLFSCRRKHVDCVAITDHNKISGALDIKPWLESRGISVIVGEEVFSSKGEIIGLWLTNEIAPGLSPEDTVAEIKRQGGAVYIPHPYDEKRFRTVLDRDELLRVACDVDCVEVHNGRNIDQRFDEEQEVAYEQVARINPDAKRVIGCDAHCFFEIGRNVVITDSPISRGSFPTCLGSAVFESSAFLPLAHRTTKLVRLIKMVKGGDFRGIARVLARKLSR
jgi:predicted metal-dependent phosphoesterase TrpH